jgi:predicted nucleotidyltransferase
MDEIFKNNTYKILELFIQFPNNDFSIRGISRKLKLSHATVIKYIKYIEKLKLIKKKEETLYPTFFANTQNQKYVFYKKNYIIFNLIEIGIIETIQKKTLSSLIILFGSCAKATFTENSDIDIFVQTKKTNINLAKFEKKLNRKINIIFEEDIKNLSTELRNNIINGIILYGFLRI